MPLDDTRQKSGASSSRSSDGHSRSLPIDSPDQAGSVVPFSEGAEMLQLAQLDVEVVSVSEGDGMPAPVPAPAPVAVGDGLSTPQEVAVKAAAAEDASQWPEDQSAATLRHHSAQWL